MHPTPLDLQHLSQVGFAKFEWVFVTFHGGLVTDAMIKRDNKGGGKQ